jgi:hypothetical protein
MSLSVTISGVVLFLAGLALVMLVKHFLVESDAGVMTLLILFGFGLALMWAATRIAPVLTEDPDDPTVFKPYAIGLVALGAAGWLGLVIADKVWNISDRLTTAWLIALWIGDFAIVVLGVRLYAYSVSGFVP